MASTLSATLRRVSRWASSSLRRAASSSTVNVGPRPSRTQAASPPSPVVGDAAERLGVEHAGRDRAGRGERPGRVDRDHAAGVDDAGAEADRRAVALADLADAHHEAQLAVGEARLVGCRDHRRVAQRGGLHGVLVGERGAEQQAPVAGQLGPGRQPVGDAVGVAPERAGEVAVASAEARRRSRRASTCTSASSSSRTCSTTPDALPSPPWPARAWPGTKSCVIDPGWRPATSRSGSRVASGVGHQPGTGSRARACCSVEISASVGLGALVEVGAVGVAARRSRRRSRGPTSRRRRRCRRGTTRRPARCRAASSASPVTASARAQASAIAATSIGCWSNDGARSPGPAPPTAVGDR